MIGQSDLIISLPYTVGDLRRAEEIYGGLDAAKTVAERLLTVAPYGDPAQWVDLFIIDPDWTEGDYVTDPIVRYTMNGNHMVGENF